jgi:hypothetical protein
MEVKIAKYCMRIVEISNITHEWKSVGKNLTNQYLINYNNNIIVAEITFW